MKYSLFFLFLLFLASSILHADTLELTNGDTITGKIIELDEEEIVIETDYGRLEIKRDKVKKGVFTGNGTETKKSDIEKDNPPDNNDPGNIPENGLLCELLFDGTFTDTRGTLYTLKNTGDVPFGKGIDGIENHAIYSDGTGRHLMLSGRKELDGLAAFTISFWIFVEDWEKTQYILSKWTSTNGNKADGKFAVYTKQGFILCYIVDTTGTYHSVYTDKPMKLGAWNHVAITFEKGNAIIFVNNVKAGNKIFEFGELKDDSSPLYILTAKAAAGDTFAYYSLKGMMDNLRIYNRTLKEDEMEVLYLEKK